VSGDDGQQIIDVPSVEETFHLSPGWSGCGSASGVQVATLRSACEPPVASGLGRPTSHLVCHHWAALGPWTSWGSWWRPRDSSPRPESSDLLYGFILETRFSPIKLVLELKSSVTDSFVKLPLDFRIQIFSSLKSLTRSFRKDVHLVEQS